MGSKCNGRRLLRTSNLFVLLVLAVFRISCRLIMQALGALSSVSARVLAEGHARAVVKNTFIEVRGEPTKTVQRSRSAPPSRSPNYKPDVGDPIQSEPPKTITTSCPDPGAPAPPPLAQAFGADNVRPWPMLPQTHNKLVAELAFINDRYLATPAWGLTHNAAGTHMKFKSVKPRPPSAAAKQWFLMTHFFKSDESPSHERRREQIPRPVRPSRKRGDRRSMRIRQQRGRQPEPFGHQQDVRDSAEFHNHRLQRRSARADGAG